MPTVLVVDDVPLMRDTLCRVLRREGFEAFAAEDGVQAIGLVGTAPPDLILLDMNMPRMGGLEVLEQLRLHPDWRNVPVMVISGFADTSTMRRAEALGAREFLPKASFNIPEMLERVRAHTGYKPN
jgi:CheY-like chemotaxis protein